MLNTRSEFVQGMGNQLGCSHLWDREHPKHLQRRHGIYIWTPVSSKNEKRCEVNGQNGENGLSGFDRTIHWSAEFEENVRRVVDHIRLVVA